MSLELGAALLTQMAKELWPALPGQRHCGLGQVRDEKQLLWESDLQRIHLQGGGNTNSGAHPQ